MARLDRISIPPVKSLGAVDVNEVPVLPSGALANDREYAMYDESGDLVNGKRTARVHGIETEYDPDTQTLTLRHGQRGRSFSLPNDRDHASRWLGDALGKPVELRRNTTTGFTDRPDYGPSVISTATLETVADWFDDLTVENARRRMRANLEISGVPAFWEDRFVGTDAPTFSIGDVTLRGVGPCGRCVVPERDPHTGERLTGFRKRFVEKRRETLPNWADPDAFETLYSLMTITEIPEAARGPTVTVGDSVAVTD